MTGKSSSNKSVTIITPIGKDHQISDKKIVENPKKQKSPFDSDVENCLASETHKLYHEPKDPADLSHLMGRLGVDLGKLVRGYHGESKLMRN